MPLKFDVERRELSAIAPVAGLTTLADRTILVTDPAAGSGAATGGPSSLVALDERLAVVAESTVGHGAAHIASDPGRGRLYVVNAGAASESVSLLDINLLATIAQCRLGPGLGDVAVDGFAGLAYVANVAARRVHVLHADDLRVVDEIGDGAFAGPRALAVDERLQRLYVARWGRREQPELHALSVVQRRSTGRHTVDRTIPLGAGTRPAKVAVDVGAGVVHVLCQGGRTAAPQLAVFDRQTLDELGRVPLGTRPTALSASNGVAFVSVANGVQVVDGRRLETVGLVRTPDPRFIAPAGPDRVVASDAAGAIVRLREAHDDDSAGER